MMAFFTWLAELPTMLWEGSYDDASVVFGILARLAVVAIIIGGGMIGWVFLSDWLHARRQKKGRDG
jgi:hypothetical protein